MIKPDDDQDFEKLPISQQKKIIESSISQITTDIKDLESLNILNNNTPVDISGSIVGYGDCCGDLPQRVSELEERMDKIEDWAEKFENRVTSTLAKMRKTQINYELED